jgi:hypothetical protein
MFTILILETEQAGAYSVKVEEGYFCRILRYDIGVNTGTVAGLKLFHVQYLKAW